MEATVFVMVIAAALLHAVWNAVVKIQGDRLVVMAIVTGTGGIFSLLVLPFVAFRGEKIVHSVYVTSTVSTLWRSRGMRSPSSARYSTVKGSLNKSITCHHRKRPAYVGQSCTGSDPAGRYCVSLILHTSFSDSAPANADRSADKDR